jgi:hypothetical protein
MFCHLSTKPYTHPNVYQALIAQYFTIQNKAFITSDKYLLQQISILPTKESANLPTLVLIGNKHTGKKTFAELAWTLFGQEMRPFYHMHTPAKESEQQLHKTLQPFTHGDLLLSGDINNIYKYKNTINTLLIHNPNLRLIIHTTTTKISAHIIASLNSRQIQYIYFSPLKNRACDILPLTRHFLQKTAKIQINKTAQQLLLDYSWPKGSFELQQVLLLIKIKCKLKKSYYIDYKTLYESILNNQKNNYIIHGIDISLLQQLFLLAQEKGLQTIITIIEQILLKMSYEIAQKSALRAARLVKIPVSTFISKRKKIIKMD